MLKSVQVEMRLQLFKLSQQQTASTVSSLHVTSCHLMRSSTALASSFAQNITRLASSQCEALNRILLSFATKYKSYFPLRFWCWLMWPWDKSLRLQPEIQRAADLWGLSSLCSDTVANKMLPPKTTVSSAKPAPLHDPLVLCETWRSCWAQPPACHHSLIQYVLWTEPRHLRQPWAVNETISCRPAVSSRGLTSTPARPLGASEPFLKLTETETDQRRAAAEEHKKEQVKVTRVRLPQLWHVWCSDRKILNVFSNKIRAVEIVVYLI